MIRRVPSLPPHIAGFRDFITEAFFFGYDFDTAHVLRITGFHFSASLSTMLVLSKPSYRIDRVKINRNTAIISTVQRIALMGVTLCLAFSTGCAAFRGQSRYQVAHVPHAANLPNTVLPGDGPLEQQFERVFTGKPEFSRSEAKRLSSCAVVLVPGFTSDIVIAFEKARIGNMLGGYFDDQMAWLRNQATPAGPVDVQRVEVESEGSVTNNSRILFKTIQSINKPVILIGHSKGGLEILDLLINYPEARQKVIGWAALQSPFLGSPLADLNYDNEIRRVSFGAFLQLMGGSDESLRDLSTSVRM